MVPVGGLHGTAGLAKGDMTLLLGGQGRLLLL